MTPTADGAASPLQRWEGAWQGFWYAQGSTLGLAVFRILFAGCLFAEVSLTRSVSVYAIDSGFQLPYVPFIQPVSERTYHWIHHLQYPFVALLGLGAWMRTSCGVLLGLQGYIFFADSMNFRNHPYFFLLVLLLLLFSPADESLSIRSVRRMHRERSFSLAALLGSARPLTLQRLLQVQVCIVYFFAALHKLHPYYLRGEVLAAHAGREFLRGDSATVLGWFLDPQALAKLQTWVMEPAHMIAPALLTVALELLLPFALWFRRSRPWAILVGSFFHLSIALLMDIDIFSAAVIASYLLFLEPETLPAALRAGLWRWRKRERALAPAQRSGSMKSR